MSQPHEIQRRLIADYRFKLNGSWLQQGKCPACQQYQAYTSTEKPYSIRCGRENNCGKITAVRDLYPDLFGQYNKKHKATRANPNATADAYMRLERGFDLAKINGWYSQGKWGSAKHGNKTATVRFTIAEGVYMERFVESVFSIDPQTGEKESRKQSFKGSFSGHAWLPPDFMAKDGEEIWITEGIIDAISLIQSGYNAIASLSAQHYPEKTLESFKGKNIRLVWALDNDHAGKKWMRNHADKSRKDGFHSGAAYIPTKSGAKDWNELFVREGVTDEIIRESRYHGQLLLAKNAHEKAKLIFYHTGSRFFCIEFGNRTYGVEVTNTEEDGDKVNLKAIANFAINFQYFMRNDHTDESWYVANISFPHKGSTIQCAFNGAQISSAAEFKKRVISVAPGAVYTGTNAHLNWLCQTHLFAIKTVETIDFIGYSKKHNIYLLDQYAFHQGRQYKRNQQNYFTIGDIAITSLQSSVSLEISASREYCADWVEPFFTTFAEKGIVALAFWMGTLFAEQIRERHRSFPFLEIIGEAGSGKTSLIEFLWKLYGRPDEEGFDPAKATQAGLSRKFSQISNLPIVLIEADREPDAIKTRKFDWEELKPLYNGRGTRTRGVKNSGNETYDPPFRAALVVAQNDAVNGSPAVMQRFVCCEINKEAHNSEAKKTADQLSLTKLESLSYFIAKVLSNEQTVLKKFFTQFEKYERYLMEVPEIRTQRIAKNHAQILALVDALFTVIELQADTQKQVRGFIKDMAIERERAIGGDHPVVSEFWEIAEYLHEISDNGINHCKAHAEVGINLNQFIELASIHRQTLPQKDILCRHLKSGSKTRPLTHASHNVDSRISDKPVRCWKFKDIPHSVFTKKSNGSDSYGKNY